jgi:predicted Zn-dependent protease
MQNRRPRNTAQVRAHAQQPSASQPSASQPKAKALVRQEPKAYVATADLALEEYQPHKTQFLRQVKEIDAMTVIPSQPNVPARANVNGRTLAELRGYDRDDLFVIAEVAYHYLFNGGTRLALVLFEGLAAVAPKEAYFALALGLTHDHLGEVPMAHKWYAKAVELDPTDGRPDVNRAELYIEAKDLAKARQYLARGATKARKRGDERLAKKAVAILTHLDRRAS